MVVQAPATARFQPGDAVRVRVAMPAGHCRTPAYVRGKIGRVASIHGAFGNPESLAYGGDGRPNQFLYLVRFQQRDLWRDYAGEPHDTLLIDLYQHWLEPA